MERVDEYGTIAEAEEEDGDLLFDSDNQGMDLSNQTSSHDGKQEVESQDEKLSSDECKEDRMKYYDDDESLKSKDCNEKEDIENKSMSISADPDEDEKVKEEDTDRKSMSISADPDEDEKVKEEDTDRNSMSISIDPDEDEKMNEEDAVDMKIVRFRSERKHRQTEAKKRMLALLEGSSVSGLGHATGASSWIARIIWTVLMICGFIGLAINLTQLFSRFLKKPILTMYVAESEDFHWPDITFCNHMNPIHFWKHPWMIKDWKKLIKKTQIVGKLRYKGRTFPGMQHVLAMSTLDPIKFHLGEAKPMVYRMQARTKSIKISSSAGYFERFDKLHWKPNEFITRSVPTPFPTPCYTFNPKNHPWLVKMEKSNHTLRTLQFNLIMDFSSYAVFNSSYENRGLYMYMTERGSTVTTSEMIQISPGSTTTIQLSMTVMERLRERLRCSPEAFVTELYDADLLTTRIYNGSYDDCRHYVSQKMYLKFCGCYNPMLPIHASDQHPPRLCLNMTKFSPNEIRSNIDCLNRAMSYYSSGNYFHKEMKRRCHRYKLPACTHISYKQTQVTRSWPEHINGKRMDLLARFAKHMGIDVKDPQDGVSYVRQNIAVVEINKKYSKAKLIKEEYEYPVSQLISDIGGTLGLWVGLSFVGLFELVEIVLVVVNYIYSEVKVEKKAYNAQQRIKRRQSVVM